MSAISGVERLKYIGSSEVAALFGESPWLTARQLYHTKRGELPPPDLTDDVRVLCGMELEAAIARIVARLHGLKVRKVRRYMRDMACPGLGASIDYELLGPGMAPLEIKNVDRAVWHRDWLQDPERAPRHDEILTDVEPPLHVELQVQCQLAASGRSAAFVAVLVAGNCPFLCRRPRHAPTIALIRERVADFWRRVRENDPPPLVPDDRATMAALYRETGRADDPPLDLTDDDGFAALCKGYAEAKGEADDARRCADLVAAELMERLGGATRARGPDGWICSWPVVRRAAAVREVPASTYRGGLRVTRRAEREEAA